jgi:hypothetical protein
VNLGKLPPVDRVIPGNNYFYLKVTNGAASQGYAVTIIRAPDSGKEITGFYFDISGKKYGIGPGTEPGWGAIDSLNNITVYVPGGTTISAMTPVVSHTGTSYSPGGQQNFSSPKTYTVTAMDTTFQAYQVTVIILETTLSVFKVNNVIPPGFDPGSNSVTMNVPFATSSAALEGTTLDSGATLAIFAGPNDSFPLLTSGTGGANTGTPVSLGVGNNYFYLKVTNGAASRGYAVTIIRAAPSSSKDITGFYFGIDGKKYGIGPGTETGWGEKDSFNNITVYVPGGTGINAITPIVSLSHTGASYSPGGSQNFSNSETTPVIYTVTAEDTTSRNYQVTVIKRGIVITGIANEALSSFSFSGVSSSVTAGDTITIEIEGVTVTAWHIDMNGVISTSSGIPPNRVAFAAPLVPGFYNVNVIATVDGVDYSGSFGLIVEME